MKTVEEALSWFSARPLSKRGREQFISHAEFAELVEFAEAQGHIVKRGGPLVVFGTAFYEEVLINISGGDSGHG